MIVATNPGSNLPKVIAQRFGIVLTPQQIVVDGDHHDTRGDFGLEQVDQWVDTANTHPYVLGTSAAEYAQLFRELSKRDSQLISIQTSRKIIQSHDAALAAVRTLKDTGVVVQIEVVDTMMTDVGAGLTCILAAEAARSGLPIDRAANVARAFAAEAHSLVLPATLTNLVKGGRASFLRAWLADVLKVRPLLSFVDGEVKAASKVKTNVDRVATLVDGMAARIDPERPVWAAVSHGGCAGEAAALAHAVRQRFDVRCLYVTPMATSIYLHCGPDVLALFAAPIDELAWSPPRLDL